MGADCSISAAKYTQFKPYFAASSYFFRSFRAFLFGPARRTKKGAAVGLSIAGRPLCRPLGEHMGSPLHCYPSGEFYPRAKGARGGFACMTTK